MECFENFEKFCKALKTNGAFLVVSDGEGHTNIMTIGWAQMGFIWGKVVMSVLVRPSRYTFKLMEKAKYFTVCVPPEGEMKRELAFCGSKSGRDHDKVKECGFSLKKGGHEELIYIGGAELVYECKMLEHAQMLPSSLARGVKAAYYADDDYHTIYFGEMLGAHKG